MAQRCTLLLVAAWQGAAYIPSPQRLRPALQLSQQQEARAQRVAQMAPPRHLCRLRAADDDADEDPELLLAKAEFLRQQAAYLEESMPKREPIGLQPQESKDPSLDGMTVVVTGANGEVGSIVTEELLRRGCRVRAVVRSAEDQGSYERLSYAVGAESLQGEIEAPWILRDTSEGGPLFNSPAVNRSRK